MPLILPSNSISALGYDVANSLRFDDGSAEYLSRTATTPTQNNTFVFSVWTKISKLGNNCIFTGGSDSSNYGYLAFSPSGTLNYREIHSGTAYTLTSNALYRDTSAWYHIYVQTDLSQSTANNRVKIFVNGEQVTSFSGESYPPQNSESRFKQTGTNFQKVGDVSGSTDTFRYRGYMAEVCYIDTTSSNDYDVITPTSFGEFDEDTGIWKPIDVSGLTFGTNGFYLDFENSGSLGADVSGNGNNFTVNNLTSIDQTTDTPTNNYSTLNPLVYSSASKTYGEGNTAILTSSSDDWCTTANNIGVRNGKWYAEIKINSIGSFHAIGVGYFPYTNTNSTQLIGELTGSAGWRNNGVLVHGGSNLNTYTTGDILMIAMDLDNQKLYFGKNGTWENSGVPTSGATGTGSVLNLTANEDYFFVICPRGGSTYCNFGNPAFTISSGNSDGNGMGNFEYQPPSGYLALCTKNLATDG
jgi:hypothetical protein